MRDLQFHPLAEIFPLIEGQEFDELVADIKARGLKEPISTSGGLIVDGRNRYRACKAAEVELKGGDAGELPPGTDLVAFVISANLRRRHMDDDARAIVAAKLATLKQGARRDLSPIGGMSQAAAAAALNVSKRKVERVVKVRTEGVPELGDALERREVSASAAAAVASLPAAEQKKIVAAGPEAVKEAARAIRETPKETVDPAETKDVVDDIVRDDAKAPTPAEFLARHKPTLAAWSDEAWREFARLLAEFRPVVGVLKPAVPINKSLRDDFMICLEDGRKFKTLTRHLRTQYNLTPEEYREKWGLPDDYPMNAPAHAEVLSEKARKRGRRRSSESRSATARGKKHSPEAVAKRAAALRGRKRTPESIAKMVATRAAKRAAEQSAAA